MDSQASLFCPAFNQENNMSLTDKSKDESAEALTLTGSGMIIGGVTGAAAHFCIAGILTGGGIGIAAAAVMYHIASALVKNPETNTHTTKSEPRQNPNKITTKQQPKPFSISETGAFEKFKPGKKSYSPTVFSNRIYQIGEGVDISEEISGLQYK